jgi:ribonuclease PH
MDGVLPIKTFTECVDLAIEGCLQVNEIQREALKKKYGLSEEAEE